MKNQAGNENVDGKQKVAVVTGSSSGIGYATALRLAKSGYLTFATMRNPEKGGAGLAKAAENEKLLIRIEQLDVTDLDSINGFMDRIAPQAGRIDVLVNNAGYFSIGSLEDLSMKQIQDQLDTNLLGAIRVTRQVLPVMRKQKGGTIVNISSVVGRFGLPGMSAYVATKFALEGLSESLAHEVEPFGIRVTLIEPGVVKTRIFDNTVIGQGARRTDSPYSGLLAGLNSTVDALREHASTPDQVAETVLQAISSPEPKIRYHVGQDATMWLEKKSAMTDEQFQEYMKNSFASPVLGQR
ncbi:MAG TPA: SDR family oxidoreductase [Nitrososphaera sp.]|jgi:NAD(P)-dependent dehydrogenase (short-subunit alcohol dehydrogenase family)|nr:SDR family oxidoreductase [uncultured Nitrososphaera sp.]